MNTFESQTPVPEQEPENTYEQFIAYIASLLQEGKSAEQISSDLLAEGWDREDIKAALIALGQNVESFTPPSAQITESANSFEPVAVTTKREKTQFIFFMVVTLSLVITTSSLAVFYVIGAGPFKSTQPYSEENLVSGIVASIARMETFSYSVNGQLFIEDRESDAVPFVLEPTPEMQIRQQQLSRDAERFSDLQIILSRPRSPNGWVKNLSLLETTSPNTIRDPLTSQIYAYRTVGDDFELTIKFETDQALEAIEAITLYQMSGMNNQTTRVDKNTRTVVFNSRSSRSYWFYPNNPKPYLQELSDAMVYLPPELAFDVKLEAKTDVSKEFADWQIALDINGDFGDLIYRLAGDMMKIEDDFYLRIRHIPSFLLGISSFEKNTWVRASSEWLRESNYMSGLNVPAYLIPSKEDEAEYRKRRTEFSQFAVEMIKLADEIKVLSVVNTPVKQDRGSKELFPYQLVINKDKVVPFYEKFITTAEKYEATEDLYLSNQASMLDYLKSSEFDSVFEYYLKNTSLIVWVNDDGFIELVEYSLRVVPPDDATHLADKQARLIFSFGFSDINKPTSIQPPTEYKEGEDFMNEFERRSIGSFDDSNLDYSF